MGQMTLDQINELYNQNKLNGIYDNVPNSVYHHRDCVGISRSALNKIAVSVTYYYDSLSNIEDKKPSEALLLGDAFHNSILMPDFFNQNYVVAPDFKYGPTAIKGIAERKEWQEVNPNKIALDQDQMDMILRCRDAVLNHSLASLLLKNTLNENVIWWTDPETGILCKLKADALNTSEGICIDLKTTKCASKHYFEKSVIEYLYDEQAGFYLDGITTVFPNFENFIFIVVEKTDKPQVAIYNCPDEMIQTGRELYKRDLNIYKNTIKNGITTYPKQIQQLDFPRWAQNIDNRFAKIY